MSKYEPLGAFLRAQKTERIAMSFAEIERILKAKLPPSKQHRAWWSNNPSNNVMTRQWLDAGYKTSDVDPDMGRLVFLRDGKVQRSGNVSDFWERMKSLKGLVTVLDEESLVRPVFDEADWDIDNYGRTKLPAEGK